MSPRSSTSSFDYLQSGNEHRQLHGFNIVSEQSTSRPGCIIELEALKSAPHVSDTMSGSVIRFNHNCTHAYTCIVYIRGVCHCHCCCCHVWRFVVSFPGQLSLAWSIRPDTHTWADPQPWRAVGCGLGRPTALKGCGSPQPGNRLLRKHLGPVSDTAPEEVETVIAS